MHLIPSGIFFPSGVSKILLPGSSGYLTGASNSKKRLGNITIVQPLEDDAEFEDVCEN